MKQFIEQRDEYLERDFEIRAIEMISPSPASR